MLIILVMITILILLALVRAAIGPTIADRLISVNAITSLVSVLILLLAFFHEEYGLVDIALVFMLCAFVGGLWILRAFVPSDREPTLPDFRRAKPD